MLYTTNQSEIEVFKKMEQPDQYILYIPGEGPKSYQKLPQTYFPIPQQPFTFVNTGVELSEDSLRTLLSQSSVQWVNPLSELSTGESLYAQLRIKYNGTDFLPSSADVKAPFYLTHRFFQSRELVNWDQPKIPLTMDVRDEHFQLLPIEMPAQECEIEIEFALTITSIGAEVRSERIPLTLRN